MQEEHLGLSRGVHAGGGAGGVDWKVVNATGAFCGLESRGDSSKNEKNIFF